MRSMPEADPYLERILRILSDALRGVEYRVYLFGSRATGRQRRGSDYDVAIEAQGEMSSALSRAREALEESTIPFQVDVVNLADASGALRDRVRREGIQVWSGSASD